jgi:predicted TIM-barrel fold metal-dependent hydrolase
MAAASSGASLQAPAPIWDCHCHLLGVSGDTSERRAAELVKYADRIGIERFVVFMGYPPIEDPTPEQLREQNDQVERAVAAFPDRALGYVYLNPNHLQFSLEEFDRRVRDGRMVGVKLWVAAHANAPSLDPIVERAAAAGAVIYQHTWWKVGGNLQGESTPLDVVALARRHPKVQIICGHVGGDWERGVRAVRGAGNVLIDIAGFDATAGAVEMAVRELGAERVLYGSDAGIRGFASQLAKVLGANIPDPARRQILSGNIRRMLAPIMKAKGLRA